MTELDIFASERQYLDHLAPVWRALPDQVRGRFAVSARLADHATRRGIPYTTDVSGRLGPILVASHADERFARHAGRRSIAYMEHGAGQSYSSDQPSYAGGRDHDAVGLFLVPNQHAASRWRARYPNARVEVVGSPRIDDLPRRLETESWIPTVAFSFHWNSSAAPETRSAFAWYARDLPTIVRDLALGDIAAIGHAHPRFREARRRYERMGIEFVEDFEDVCRRADIYACDNSSTIFEFASTNRPVILLNAPWYRRTVNHGLRFWDAADVGIQVDRPGELPTIVDAALSDWPDQAAKREAALSLVYSIRTNGAANAVTALLDWLAA